ncbi:hypothetical protein PTKIN_Ptkin10aG0109000 [Pterospermum kingtungense]
MSRPKTANVENEHEYSPQSQITLRLCSNMQADHESESLGSVFSHFMTSITTRLNFNVSNSKLAVTWELDLAFESQLDNGCEILFTGIEGTIFYMEDIALVMTSWQPFGPGSKEQKKVHLEFVTSGWEGDQPIVEDTVLKEEQFKGMFHFSMRINTFVTYQKWGLLWRGSQPSYCWDLMVKFAPETGAGRLFGRGQKGVPSIPWPVISFDHLMEIYCLDRGM